MRSQSSRQQIERRNSGGIRQRSSQSLVAGAAKFKSFKLSWPLNWNGRQSLDGFAHPAPPQDVDGRANCRPSRRSVCFYDYFLLETQKKVGQCGRIEQVSSFFFRLLTIHVPVFRCTQSRYPPLQVTADPSFSVITSIFRVDGSFAGRSHFLIGHQQHGRCPGTAHRPSIDRSAQ